MNTAILRKVKFNGGTKTTEAFLYSHNTIPKNRFPRFMRGADAAQLEELKANAIDKGFKGSVYHCR